MPRKARSSAAGLTSAWIDALAERRRPGARQVLLALRRRSRACRPRAGGTAPTPRRGSRARPLALLVVEVKQRAAPRPGDVVPALLGVEVGDLPAAALEDDLGVRRRRPDAHCDRRAPACAGSLAYSRSVSSCARFRNTSQAGLVLHARLVLEVEQRRARPGDRCRPAATRRSTARACRSWAGRTSRRRRRAPRARPCRARTGYLPASSWSKTTTMLSHHLRLAESPVAPLTATSAPRSGGIRIFSEQRRPPSRSRCSW